MDSSLDPDKLHLLKGSTIDAIRNRQDALWGGDNIQRGPGVYRRGSGTAGLTLATRKPAPVPPFLGLAKKPFQLSWRKNPSNPSLFQAQINPQSDVLLSPQSNQSLTVTGLGTWFDFLATDVVALNITVTSYVASAPTIKSYGLGTTSFDPTLAAWSANSYLINDGGTPPSQTQMNILIAYSVPNGSGNPFVVQCQNDHILLETGFVNSEPCIFDFSHRRRWGIAAP